MNKFWNFVRNAENTPVLYLYGPISDATWFGDEVTPKAFVAELQAHLDADEIHVRINSPGGDVFAATAIYSNLRDTGKRIVTTNDGICASAATIPFMSGDVRRGRAVTTVMVHKPETGIYGNSDDFKKGIEVLDKVQACIVEAYGRTGLDQKKLSKMMDEVTWMSGREALINGFFTEVIEDEPGSVQNCAAFSFAEMKNINPLPPNADGAVPNPQPVTDHTLSDIALKLKIEGF